jgi:hypothetical protein
MTGTISDYAEGIYYFDYYLVGSYTYALSASSYMCPYPSYWYYYDNPALASLKRFMSSARIKFIVNDETIDPPSINIKIPD